MTEALKIPAQQPTHVGAMLKEEFLAPLGITQGETETRAAPRGLFGINTAGLSPAGYPPRGRLLASLFARASLRGPQTGSWITPSRWPRP